MGSILSTFTELKNANRVHAIVVEVTLRMGMAPIARVIIPPGEFKDICCDILDAEANPYRQPMVSVSVEDGVEHVRHYILPNVIRNNTKLVLSYDHGEITAVASQGNVMARIGCLVWLRRTMAALLKFNEP